MPEHTIHLETPPETPDLLPQISAMRERLARLEERTEHPHSDPAVAESLSLASAAHQTAEALRERLERLEENVAGLPAAVNEAAEQTAREVDEVQPPQALQTPAPADLEPSATENREHHHPWWSPMRYL